MKFVRSSIILLALKIVHAIDIPVVCMSAPVVPLSPGMAVAARLDSHGKRCEAALIFTNPDFFPVRFDFKPMNCSGYQGAEFTVPKEVPNGDAFILWQCADEISPTCTKGAISGGSQDANAIDFDQSGTISCILPVATQTTLVTVILPSTTFIETATSTILSTSVLPFTSLTNSVASSMAVTPTATVSPSSLSSGVQAGVSTPAIISPSTVSSTPSRVQTVVSTLSNSAVTTFTSIVSPSSMTAGSQSMITISSTASILTSLFTITITAPCSAIH